MLDDITKIRPPTDCVPLPLRTEETMYIISEVTLMESKEAMNMRKPSEVIEVLAEGLK